MSLGYEFSPDDQKRRAGLLNKGGLVPNSQQAIRILSLNLPNVLGGKPISPDQLLSQPSAAQAPSAVASSVARSVGADPSSGGQPSLSSLSNPTSFETPSLTPPASQPFSTVQPRSESSQLSSLVRDTLSGSSGGSAPPPRVTPGDTSPNTPPELVGPPPANPSRTVTPEPAPQQPGQTSDFMQQLADFLAGKNNNYGGTYFGSVYPGF